ncbi:hypothetical protein COOONC_26930 [Cooperia oncophora]
MTGSERSLKIAEVLVRLKWSRAEWIRKLPVDMRTTLMQIMNIDLVMRYDSFREVEAGELPAVAHRNLLSAIDWVDHLFDIIDIQNLDDKVATVKHCFAPLMVSPRAYSVS